MNDHVHQSTYAENIRLNEEGTAIIIIDQTKLPNILEYLTLDKAESIYDAISELKVRGAPAIGICAAFGIYLLSRKLPASNFDEFYKGFLAHKDYLNSSRPTAVNLSWALGRMEQSLLRHKNDPIQDILHFLHAECIAIQEEDIAMCKSIAEFGLSLIKDGEGILTHCNAGPLATSRYGTGLGALLLGREKGLSFKVYVDETRPLLQGARLTSYELEKAGLDVTLICDNMASLVMKQGLIHACFVGCDRVAANGDTANKIGTSGVAILAKHYGIPFYVFCPSSTIDFSCKTGDDITIELRDPSEIKEKFFISPIALPETKCYNPAFDVTDHKLITAIVTEHGICYPPYSDSLKQSKTWPSIDFS